MVVNFLSHPVVNGFTNAAAIIIATSQLSKLFGVEVDSAEHHYKTVYLVIREALHNTHWQTFVLGALAFAIMIVLKRVNRKLPNVLLAVLVTTLISWATGYEHNVVTRIERIHSREVDALLEEYNFNLAEVDRTIEERFTTGTERRQAEHEYGSHSNEAIELHAQWAKLSARVDKLKDRGEELKSKLRRLRFLTVEASDKHLEFYSHEELPAGVKPEKRKWSLKVRNRPMDKTAIMMIGGGAVVGTIPAGIPKISAPKLNFPIMLDLLSMAVIISLLGFMEAISIAKAMATRTGQRLDPNQELIGQGLANIIGALSRSYPVSGSFSRSAVNFQAGGRTGFSSAFTSIMVMISLLFFTPLLYHLPQSVLAAIIMMAVIGLINVGGFIHAWKAQRYDGVISVVSFLFTLGFAPHLDKGIIIGVLLSIGLYLFRTMKPPIAILSKTPQGFYRDAKRWNLEICKHVAVIRFNYSLYFANVNYLEDQIIEEISNLPYLKHIVIVGNGINELDASGEVMLSLIVSRLREMGLDVSFTGLNDHVLEVLHRTHLYEKIGGDHFYFSVAEAVEKIHKGSCIGIPGEECPLLTPKLISYKVAPEIVEKLKKEPIWNLPKKVKKIPKQEN